MNTRTSPVARAILSLVLGYPIVGFLDWIVFQSVTISGTTTLVILGGLYVLVAILLFVTLTAVESAARARGLISPDTDIAYEVAITSVLWGLGAMLGYGLSQSFLSGGTLLLTMLGGVVTVLIGQFLLRNVRIDRLTSRSPKS